MKAVNKMPPVLKKGGLLFKRPAQENKKSNLSQVFTKPFDSTVMVFCEPPLKNGDKPRFLKRKTFYSYGKKSFLNEAASLSPIKAEVKSYLGQSLLNKSSSDYQPTEIFGEKGKTFKNERKTKREQQRQTKSLSTLLPIDKHNEEKRLKNLYPGVRGTYPAIGKQTLFREEKLFPCFDATSSYPYCGRKHYRDAWIVLEKIRTLLFKPKSPTWILEAVFEKDFDKMNDWLLKNEPSCSPEGPNGFNKTEGPNGFNKTVGLKKRQPPFRFFFSEPNRRGNLNLKLPPTDIRKDETLSPTLANILLDGLEQHLYTPFEPESLGSKKGNFEKNINQEPSLNLVRYAENFLVTGRSQQQLEQVKFLMNAFLEPRGLSINERNVKILHISQGFDFLGWNFRKFNGKLLIQISKSSLSQHRKEIKYLTKKIHEPEILIPKLNRKILDWTNYHHCCNGLGDVWGSMNKYLYECLMKWGLRRHGKKTKKWVFNKYWKIINQKWTFFVEKGEETYKLLSYNLAQKQNQSRRNSF